MTLYAEQTDNAVRERMPRAKRVGWILLIASVVALLVLGFSPSPYVIERPGPVFNTLGVDSAAGQPAGPGAKPVISIPGKTTYPTKGALYMLTVSVVGNPQQLPNWFQVASAWFQRSESVVPVEVEFPQGQTADQADQQNALEMSNSQQDATAAALTKLGYTIPGHVVIAGVEAGAPAKGKLKADDRITKVDGAAISTVSQLQKAVNASDGGPVQLTVERGTATEQVSITPKRSGGKWVLGVYAGEEYGQLPVKVDFQLTDIGGPSAGMMFALGIIDKLTPGYLNGGQKVAGTGTIDASGNVGAIGGIEQKMYGARAAGATVFLAPQSNCSDVVGHIPSGLHVYAVKNLADSLKVLKTISEHADTRSLPTCHG